LARVILGDCFQAIADLHRDSIDLSFLDPPFNQGKEYRHFNDCMPDRLYWEWMTSVCSMIFEKSTTGASIYFMQREKNTENTLNALKRTGWSLQNLIIWKKLTSAVPSSYRLGKQYQIIVFATKGPRPRVFNRLRIDAPLPPNYKSEREKGVYLTDIWDDIREMTSGYLAGDEAIRINGSERFHKQQSPIHLLLRILLCSSKPGDNILDPFAGTGTTLVVAEQLNRRSLGIEIDPANVDLIGKRVVTIRKADELTRYRKYYQYTESLSSIWPMDSEDFSCRYVTSKQLSIVTG